MVRRAFTGARIHRADAIPLHAIDRAFVDAVAERLDRRQQWELTITDGTLYLTVAGTMLTGTVTALRLQDAS
jgi:uncharacterized protein YaeQ